MGPIETTIRRLLVGLAFLVIAAGILSAWLARRVIAKPLITVVDELKHVERFELDQVRRHPSRVIELANLSTAIADMAGGLAAFRKYIPADLVRTLVREGVEPRPGGAIRDLTVMFADIAGFTGLSERLGDQIIPLLSRYLDTVSREVSGHGGTIDKFIGDAVMAFWGAPAANPDHAVDACRAALACQRALRASGLADDHGRPLKVRIGINSGDMLVGNIGSEFRLNYTVIGDAVNVASRLEGANKEYGTEIIIGEETRRLAGDRIHVRELDRLVVYGRAGGLAIYELLGVAETGAAPPRWAALYESGLAAYRRARLRPAPSASSSKCWQRRGRIVRRRSCSSVAAISAIAAGKGLGGHHGNEGKIAGIRRSRIAPSFTLRPRDFYLDTADPRHKIVTRPATKMTTRRGCVVAMKSAAVGPRPGCPTSVSWKGSAMNSKSVFTAATIAGSFAAALAMIAAPAVAGPKPPQPTMDKCFGVALKGDNDCAAGAGTTCAGTAGRRLSGQCLEVRSQGHLRDHQDPEGHRLARADQVLKH